MLRFLTAVLFYVSTSASAVSAGLVSKFVPDTDKKLPFSAHAARNLKKAAIHTATSTAANGGKVGRNALSAAAGAIVDAGAASVAQEIGRVYRNGTGDMSWLTHKVCHFVLGGGSAALRGEDPLSGAIGATIGEVVADAMIQRALERTRADVLEQLEDFRANYGTLPPIQDAEALIRLTYLDHLETELIDQLQRISATSQLLFQKVPISYLRPSVKKSLTVEQMASLITMKYPLSLLKHSSILKNFMPLSIMLKLALIRLNWGRYELGTIA